MRKVFFSLSEKKNDMPPQLFYFWVYKRTNNAKGTILTSLNVFSNYAYWIQISICYSYFWYGKTETEKMGVFLHLFQSAPSPWIIKLQAQDLFQNMAYYLDYHIRKNIVIISIFLVSKHKKNRLR